MLVTIATRAGRAFCIVQDYVSGASNNTLAGAPGVQLATINKGAAIAPAEFLLESLAKFGKVPSARIMSITISIIVPVLNDPRVGLSLDSILSQRTSHSVEIVVVDGKSSDPTIKQIETRRDRIDVFISEPDDGIYDAMNNGIKAATGEIIGILNADDRYANDYVLDAVVSTLLRTGAEVCYGDLDYVTDGGKLVRRWRSGEHTHRRWFFGWMPPHPTFFVRRDTYEKHGTFDTRFKISADYELMLRLGLKHRVKFEYIPEVLVKMAPGGASTQSASAILEANREVRAAWRHNDLAFGWLVPILKPMRKIFQLNWRGLPKRHITNQVGE